MLRALAVISLIAQSGVAYGQSTETPATFEVADVHVVAKPGQFPFVRGGLMRGGRYELRTATMVDLISAAYGVEVENVIGGPSWVEWDRYDVLAKAPQHVTSPEAIRSMLQALLADRFKLVVHKDTKPLPEYVLTVGKGRPKLKEAGESTEKGCQGQPRPQNLEPGAISYIMVSCHNMTMAAFADEVHQMAGGYLTNPVVDSTGLKGAWDFDIKWTARGQLAAAGSSGISIFDAVDKQLGLKLELQDVPAPVIVVDHVNQKPTDNLPDVTKSLPVPPTEFEVADIKPSAPGSNQRGGFQPGGRLDLQSFTLKTLIQIAWDINSDDMLVGGPKWLDSDRFDVVAKASSVTLSNGPSNGPQMDIDTLRLMLRALLVDRFKLAVHNEDRPVSAYTLIAVKPKLTKADPSSRMKFKEGPAGTAKDPRNTNPALSRLVTCQNMTMAQFAEQLQNMAPGYIHSPVLDATGLEGAWDFTLNFSPAGMFRGGGDRGGDASPPPPAGAVPTASDPGSGLTLFEAIEKQLGLKLELQKRPVAVLVVDHVEQKPTDN